MEYDRDDELAGREVREALKRFGDSEALPEVKLEGIGPATPVREAPEKPFGNTCDAEKYIQRLRSGDSQKHEGEIHRVLIGDRVLGR